MDAPPQIWPRYDIVVVSSAITYVAVTARVCLVELVQFSFKS